MIESSIFTAFCELQLVVISVERAWLGRLELSGLRFAVGDARHHCCAAASFLVDYEGDSTAGYEQISGSDRVIAHEAYLSLIGLGQMLRGAHEDHLPGTRAIERTLDALGRVLDTLEPFTSGADRALRVAMLDERIEPRRAS